MSVIVGLLLVSGIGAFAFVASGAGTVRRGHWGATGSLLRTGQRTSTDSSSTWTRFRVRVVTRSLQQAAR